MLSKFHINVLNKQLLWVSISFPKHSGRNFSGIYQTSASSKHWAGCIVMAFYKVMEENHRRDIIFVQSNETQLVTLKLDIFKLLLLRKCICLGSKYFNGVCALHRVECELLQLGEMTQLGWALIMTGMALGKPRSNSRYWAVGPVGRNECEGQSWHPVGGAVDTIESMPVCRVLMVICG